MLAGSSVEKRTDARELRRSLCGGAGAGASMRSPLMISKLSRRVAMLYCREWRLWRADDGRESSREAPAGTAASDASLGTCSSADDGAAGRDITDELRMCRLRRFDTAAAALASLGGASDHRLSGRSARAERVSMTDCTREWRRCCFVALSADSRAFEGAAVLPPSAADVCVDTDREWRSERDRRFADFSRARRLWKRRSRRFAHLMRSARTDASPSSILEQGREADSTRMHSEHRY